MMMQTRPIRVSLSLQRQGNGAKLKTVLFKAAMRVFADAWSFKDTIKKAK